MITYLVIKMVDDKNIKKEITSNDLISSGFNIIKFTILFILTSFFVYIIQVFK